MNRQLHLKSLNRAFGDRASKTDSYVANHVLFFFFPLIIIHSHHHYLNNVGIRARSVEVIRVLPKHVLNRAGTPRLPMPFLSLVTPGRVRKHGRHVWQMGHLNAAQTLPEI